MPKNRHGFIKLITQTITCKTNNLSTTSHIKQISIIGAGNLAWQLGTAFHEKGINIKQIYNRTPTPGVELAKKLHAEYTGSVKDLVSADLYMIAVSDDAIEEIAGEHFFRNCTGIVIHSAGSVSMEVFEGNAKNFGVFYPLQTFTKGSKVDFSNIPVLIESNSKENTRVLSDLALLLSEKVFYANSEQRMMLHLAAVIGANFSNHLLYLCEKILMNYGLSFSLLQPLLAETLSKAMRLSPAKAQTGPAIRGNKQVVEKHLAMLENYPEVREIYRLMSESIRKSRS